MDLLSNNPIIGKETLLQLSIAEETGDLASACSEIAKSSQEVVGRRGTALAAVLGVCVAIFIVLAIVGYIIHFWISYFKQATDAGLW